MERTPRGRASFHQCVPGEKNAIPTSRKMQQETDMDGTAYCARQQVPIRRDLGRKCFEGANSDHPVQLEADTPPFLAEGGWGGVWGSRGLGLWALYGGKEEKAEAGKQEQNTPVCTPCRNLVTLPGAVVSPTLV